MMKIYVFAALGAGVFSAVRLHAQFQETDTDKGMKWKATIPARITLAAQAHLHATKYVFKHYRYQSTGKATDFFKEMGRPDKYSLQDFSLSDKRQLSLTQYPLHGSYKYEFSDGTIVYMTSARMQWVDLALLYKNRRFSRLLYK